MSRLIDADELEVVCFKDKGGCFSDGVQWALEKIDALPTIEQPKIIHCKDCRYWSDYTCFCEEHDIRCQDYYIGDMHTESDFYCGYAKRKQNEVKE